MGKRTTAKTTWERTKTPGPLRHHGGRYYARLTSGGKTRFIPLKTDLLAIARTRVRRAQVESQTHAQDRANGQRRSGDDGRRDDAHRERINERSGVSDKTKELALGAVTYIERTWPEFARLRPDGNHAIVNRRVAGSGAD